MHTNTRPAPSQCLFILRSVPAQSLPQPSSAHVCSRELCTKLWRSCREAAAHLGQENVSHILLLHQTSQAGNGEVCLSKWLSSLPFASRLCLCILTLLHVARQLLGYSPAHTLSAGLPTADQDKGTEKPGAQILPSSADSHNMMQQAAGTAEGPFLWR